MLHSAPDRRLPSVTTSQRGTSGNAASAVQIFISLGSITDINQISALNTLYTDLNSYGLWSKIQVLYPFVGGTATAHALNLKDATQYPITFTGSIVHSANGVSGTASLNASFSSTYNMTSLSANDFSFGTNIRSPMAGVSTQNLRPFDTSTGSTYLNFRGDPPYVVSQTKLANGALTSSGLYGESVAKFMAITSDSPTTAFSFQNQFQVSTGIVKGSSLTGTISASLSSTTAGAVAHTMSIWYVATAMTETELINLNTAFQKFNDTLDTAFGSTRGTDYYINPSYNRITNRFITNSGASTMTSNEKNALDYLVTSLLNSANGLWSKITYMLPIASASSLATSLKELKSYGATTGTISGTASVSATGLTSTSASSYLLSPSIPHNGAISVGMYITEELATNNFDIACAVSGRYNICVKNASGNATVQIYSGTAATAANSTSKGFYLLDAPGTTSSTFTLYKNNSSLVTATSGANQTTGVYFLGYTASSMRDVGMLFYTSVQLNATERTEIYNIISSYLTQNGRI